TPVNNKNADWATIRKLLHGFRMSSPLWARMGEHKARLHSDPQIIVVSRGVGKRVWCSNSIAGFPWVGARLYSRSARECFVVRVSHHASDFAGFPVDCDPNHVRGGRAEGRRTGRAGAPAAQCRDPLSRSTKGIRGR